MDLESEIERLAPELLRFCTGLTRNPVEGEEIAQEALVSLLQGRLSVNPVSASLLTEYGLRTLHELLPTMTMPRMLESLTKIVTDIYGPQGVKDLLIEVKRMAGSLSAEEQFEQEARGIGFMPATRAPKKDIIH